MKWTVMFISEPFTNTFYFKCLYDGDKALLKTAYIR